MTDDDTPTKVVAFLEAQTRDLKSQLEEAHSQNAQLLELSTRLQKQNELLRLPPPQPSDVSSHSYAGNNSPQPCYRCLCLSPLTYGIFLLY